MISIHIYKVLNGENNFPLEIDLEIEEGSFTAITGKSGVGKTTLLRALAGLTEVDRGKIKVGDNLWLDTEQSHRLSVQKRAIGFVFQDYALFPNMTVTQNLAFAGNDQAAIKELMDLMELGELQNRKPNTLSGGQQQRVALARALVRMPELLLLDEPLSALDGEMRHKLQEYVLEAHRRFGLTTIMVSHDVGEVFKMADTVVELSQGQVTKQAAPAQFYTSSQVSGKFQFPGEVLSIEENGVVFIVSVLAGRSVIKVIATAEEIQDIRAGSKVLVASKAFNPLLIKMDA